MSKHPSQDPVRPAEQHTRDQRTSASVCAIVPPYLLERLALLDTGRLAPAAHAARGTLAHDAGFRATAFPWTEPSTTGQTALPSAGGTLVRTIGDAASAEVLPGKIVRREGDAPTGDPATDEAYDGLGATYRLFAEVYGRNSIDGSGLGLDATVHYGHEYDNAFWDGAQMVFGDGDGEVFGRFTRSVSVIGHELTHGVTQFTAGLAYQGQSGALNESVSDVFGVLVEQYQAGQSTAAASWLIGQGLFTAEVQGEALRSMKAPGTAYDDDVLGKDPQPAHMDDYVQTDADNGGVHINSGIPNKAFYLVAAGLGGNAWERAGAIWYRALTDGELPATADFATFAGRTVAAATDLFDTTAAEVVSGAWTQVGVTPGGAPDVRTAAAWVDPDVNS
ncbi:M4 family peptidase [Nakamurella silvestris]|nr:M4 family peptidase [Nakamurella silvestris]